MGYSLGTRTQIKNFESKNPTCILYNQKRKNMPTRQMPCFLSILFQSCSVFTEEGLYISFLFFWRICCPGFLYKLSSSLWHHLFVFQCSVAKILEGLRPGFQSLFCPVCAGSRMLDQQRTTLSPPGRTEAQLKTLLQYTSFLPFSLSRDDFVCLVIQAKLEAFPKLHLSTISLIVNII